MITTGTQTFVLFYFFIRLNEVTQRSLCWIPAIGEVWDLF